MLPGLVIQAFAALDFSLLEFALLEFALEDVPSLTAPLSATQKKRRWLQTRALFLGISRGHFRK